MVKKATPSSSAPGNEGALSGDDVLLNESDAGDFLGKLSPRTMQRRRADGSGPPFVKIGHLVRYRRRMLIKYIAQHERNSTSEER